MSSSPVRQSSAILDSSTEGEQVVVGEHRPLRRAGGARRVAEHRGVRALARRELAVEVVRVFAAERVAHRLHVGEVREPRVVHELEAARIVEDHLLHVSEPLPDLEELVHLLLVLGHDEPRFRVLEHVAELGGDGVLVGRERDAAERLRGELGEVQAPAVVADDRELVAAPEPERGEAEREPAHLPGVLGPAHGLPDAVVLLAHRVAVGERAAPVRLQDLGQGVVGHASLRFASGGGAACRDRPR